jgi:hypothetical protein
VTRMSVFGGFLDAIILKNQGTRVYYVEKNSGKSSYSNISLQLAAYGGRKQGRAQSYEWSTRNSGQ